MAEVLATTATVEDDFHLRLHHALPSQTGKTLRVLVYDDARKAKPTPHYPAGYFEKSPEQRATEIDTWIASLPPGPGLSDWAVSRDSIYD